MELLMILMSLYCIIFFTKTESKMSENEMDSSEVRILLMIVTLVLVIAFSIPLFKEASNRGLL